MIYNFANKTKEFINTFNNVVAASFLILSTIPVFFWIHKLQLFWKSQQLEEIRKDANRGLIFQLRG